MTLEHNPFAEFGRPVCGERFIGRDRALRTLQARVIEPLQPGNLAFVGEPRVGKSSIVHHGIRYRRPELLSRRRIPVWLNVGLYRHGWEVFQKLAGLVFEEIEAQRWLTTEVDRLAARIASMTELNGESQSCVLEFFRAVRRVGLTVIAVLDEFDNAGRLWSSDRPGFQLLRELSHDPASAICLVTTSRRELREIELSSGVISTLAGTFMKQYVQPFSDDEMATVLARLAAAGVTLGNEEVRAIRDITGGHPLFLDMVCFCLVEAGAARDNLLIIHEEAPGQFIEIYEQHVSQMQKEGSLLKLLQILFGPVVDVTTFDLDRFLRYGTVRLVGERYEAYSKHFNGYLHALSRDSDLWPLWRDAERAIRRCVGAYLSEQYGSPWRDGLCGARPRMVTSVERWEDSRKKEEIRYGTWASTNLLDYSYPDELFGIMRNAWPWFAAVFGGPIADWDARFRVLARVRTPLAHNRVPESYGGLVEEASGICRQVLDRIYEWEMSSQKQDASSSEI